MLAKVLPTSDRYPYLLGGVSLTIVSGIEIYSSYALTQSFITFVKTVSEAVENIWGWISGSYAAQFEMQVIKVTQENLHQTKTHLVGAAVLITQMTRLLVVIGVVNVFGFVSAYRRSKKNSVDIKGAERKTIKKWLLQQIAGENKRVSSGFIKDWTEGCKERLTEGEFKVVQIEDPSDQFEAALKMARQEFKEEE